MPRAIRQSETPLPPEILRLVEGIALALAQEHHALESAGKSLFPGATIGSDNGEPTKVSQ
jgi:hypothetical protein